MRLILVADHSLVAHAVRLALRHTACFEIVGSVDGRSPVEDTLRQHMPDIVLIDDMDNPALAPARLKEVTRAVPESKRLVLTADMSEDRLAVLFEAGAHSALSKNVQPAALGTLLREVTRGSVVHRFERRQEPAVDCPLTEREREILGLVADGNTNGQIARTLWVTEQTVKFHLSNTYRKLGVTNRTEASRYAIATQIVPAVQPHRLAV